MVKVSFKIEGLQQLQQKLLEKKKQLEDQLDMRLLELCERAVTHAKDNKGYKDHTANLKNTISFALFKDGELVRQHIGINTEAKEGEAANPADSNDRLSEYCNSDGVVNPRGYSLVIVAPMEYAQHVEHKGYNVLHLTKYFLHDELKKELSEALHSIGVK